MLWQVAVSCVGILDSKRRNKMDSLYEFIKFLSIYCQIDLKVSLEIQSAFVPKGLHVIVSEPGQISRSVFFGSMAHAKIQDISKSAFACGYSQVRGYRFDHETGRYIQAFMADEILFKN